VFEGAIISGENFYEWCKGIRFKTAIKYESFIIGFVAYYRSKHCWIGITSNLRFCNERL
jgi:hypothetical protein